MVKQYRYCSKCGTHSIILDYPTNREEMEVATTLGETYTLECGHKITRLHLREVD